MSDLLNSDDNQATEQAPTEQEAQTQQDFLNWNGRSFKSQEEVIKKFEHADSYIEELKRKQEELAQQLAEKEAKLQSATKLEEAMEQLKHRDSGQQAGEHTTQPQANVEPQFDEESLLAKAEQRFIEKQQQLQQEQVQQDNLRSAHEAAQAVYGNGYIDKLVEIAKKDDLDYQSADELIELARTRPKTFKKLFGLTQERKPQAAPSGGLNVAPESRVSKSNSWNDIAAETAKKYGVEYSKGFHSNR